VRKLSKTSKFAKKAKEQGIKLYSEEYKMFLKEYYPMNRFENLKKNEKHALGEKMKMYREKAGLTLDDVAIICEVSRQFVALLERGERSNLSFDMIIRFAECYNVSLEVFAEAAYIRKDTELGSPKPKKGGE